jgi:hypothetical protein
LPQVADEYKSWWIGVEEDVFGFGTKANCKLGEAVESCWRRVIRKEEEEFISTQTQWPLLYFFRTLPGRH